ncbi:MAG: hypothetical protein H0U76_27465, partial [Ktedonobacteraceae bacterium]|nr:hypothetical protein [Ktedonobacteraceae bacterium]
MDNYEHLLPEEGDEHNQALIEELRRTYRPEFHDARALSRVRERLIAGHGWQEQGEQIPLSLPQTPQRKRSGAGEREDNTAATRTLKTGRRTLALIAAALMVSLLVGSLVVTFNLARRPSAGTGPVHAHVIAGTLLDMHMFSANTGWAVSAGNKVLRTIDGGVSWQVVTPPALQTVEKRFFLAGPWTFHDALTAWVGVTVSKQQTPDYHSIPTDLTALIFHTIDGGKTWQETVLKLSSLGASQLIFVNEHVGWLLTTSDATLQGQARATSFDIWHTTDGGKTWTKILKSSSPGEHALQSVVEPTISFGDEHVGLLIGQNNRLYRTVDGGITWQLQPWPAVTGDTVSFEKLRFFTAKDANFSGIAVHSNIIRKLGPSGFAEKYDIIVYTTHDAGLTWHASPTFTFSLSQTISQNEREVISGSNTINGPNFVNMRQGWILASAELITTNTDKTSLVEYTTTDGGIHWRPLPVNSITNHYRTGLGSILTSFISPNVGWLWLADSNSMR